MPRLLPLLLVLCVCTATRVQAQEIHRCVSPEGQSVFTDRRCQDVAAASPAPPAIGPEGTADPSGHGCPRRLSELVSLLQLAMDGHDVNRLSSLYLWSGQSDAAAHQVLSRLEAIVQRPLLGITPMYPQSGTPTLDAQATASTPSPDGSDTDTPIPTQPSHPHPWGLRLEQNLASGTAAPSVLQLHRQYNCFWVTF